MSVREVYPEIYAGGQKQRRRCTRRVFIKLTQARPRQRPFSLPLASVTFTALRRYPRSALPLFTCFLPPGPTATGSPPSPLTHPSHAAPTKKTTAAALPRHGVPRDDGRHRPYPAICSHLHARADEHVPGLMETLIRSALEPGPAEKGAAVIEKGEEHRSSFHTRPCPSTPDQLTVK